jgi:hypothetical protein
VKCEAYFTGAAPCKRLQLGGLKRIGFCIPVNGYNRFTHRNRTDTLFQMHRREISEKEVKKIIKNSEQIVEIRPGRVFTQSRIKRGQINFGLK